MQQWEYRVGVNDDGWSNTPNDTPKHEGYDDYFRAMGEGGWELVTVTLATEMRYEAAYWKRPKPAAVEVL